MHNENDFVHGPFSVCAARCALGLQQRELELRNGASQICVLWVGILFCSELSLFTGMRHEGRDSGTVQAERNVDAQAVVTSMSFRPGLDLVSHHSAN